MTTATKGLEGIVATTSSISSIIDGVLTYRGINIDDLAEHASFEEVVYLLWHGKLPTQSELEEFNQTLNDHTDLKKCCTLCVCYPKTLTQWLLCAQLFLL